MFFSEKIEAKVIKIFRIFGAKIGNENLHRTFLLTMLIMNKLIRLLIDSRKTGEIGQR